jgi:hypothetical protein
MFYTGGFPFTSLPTKIHIESRSSTLTPSILSDGMELSLWQEISVVFAGGAGGPYSTPGVCNMMMGNLVCWSPSDVNMSNFMNGCEGFISFNATTRILKVIDLPSTLNQETRHSCSRKFIDHDGNVGTLDFFIKP